MGQGTQTAFISGAASGIGRALALEPGRRGATVVVSDASSTASPPIAP